MCKNKKINVFYYGEEQFISTESYVINDIGRGVKTFVVNFQ